MTRTIFPCLLLLLLATTTASAQGTDIFIGYSFGAFEAGSSVETQTTNGMAIAVTKNFGPYFGITTDYGANFGNVNDVILAFSPLRNFTNQQLTIGPQINFRTKRWNVFVRALGGFRRQNLSSFLLSQVDCTTIGVDCSATGGVLQQDGSFLFDGQDVTKFVMNYGTGLDWKAGGPLWLRLIQIDYMPSRTSDPNRNWRQNARASAGIVLRF